MAKSYNVSKEHFYKHCNPQKNPSRYPSTFNKSNEECPNYVHATFLQNDRVIVYCNPKSECPHLQLEELIF